MANLRKTDEYTILDMDKTFQENFATHEMTDGSLWSIDYVKMGDNAPQLVGILSSKSGERIGSITLNAINLEVLRQNRLKGHSDLAEESYDYDHARLADPCNIDVFCSAVRFLGKHYKMATFKCDGTSGLSYLSVNKAARRLYITKNIANYLRPGDKVDGNIIFKGGNYTALPDNIMVNGRVSFDEVDCRVMQIPHRLWAKSVHFVNMPELSDVRGFYRSSFLTFSNVGLRSVECPLGVTNLLVQNCSALRRVNLHSQQLSRCTIQACPALTSLSSMALKANSSLPSTTVEILSLRGVPALSRISPQIMVRDALLLEGAGIERLPMACSSPRMSILDCPNLTSLRLPAGSATDLILGNCLNLRGLVKGRCDTILSLSVKNCPELEMLPEDVAVSRNLSLIDLSSLRVFPTINQRLVSLSLEECPQITTLGLDNLSVAAGLTVKNCVNLVELPQILKCKTINVADCPGLLSWPQKAASLAVTDKLPGYTGDKDPNSNKWRM